MTITNEERKELERFFNKTYTQAMIDINGPLLHRRIVKKTVKNILNMNLNFKIPSEVSVQIASDDKGLSIECVCKVFERERIDK